MGLVVGDTLGSRYEHHRTTDYNFPLFPERSHPTDDSVGALAIAGGLAAATPGMEIPQEWADKAFSLLKPDLKALLVEFYDKYPV